MKELCLFLVGLLAGIVLICSTPNMTIIDTDKATNTSYAYHNETMYKLVPIDK